MDIRNNFFTRTAGLPREVVEFLFLAVFKNHGGVTVRDTVSRHGGVGTG